MIVETISARRVMQRTTLRIRVTGLRRMRMRVWIGTMILEMARIVIGCAMTIDYDVGRIDG